jgi:hypothetical protein
MNPSDNQNEVVPAKESIITPLHKVTPLSKYFALALFVALPFVGAYVGWNLKGNHVPQESNGLSQGNFNLSSQDESVGQNEQGSNANSEFATITADDAPLSTDFVQLQDGESIVSDTYEIMGYRRTGEKIFLITTNGTEEVVREVDTESPETFFVAKDYSIYAHDTRKVFVEGVEVQGADPATFEPIIGVPSYLDISMAIGRDSKNFYVYSSALADVDMASYVPLAPFGRIFFFNGIDTDNLYTYYMKHENGVPYVDEVIKTPFVLDSGEAFKLLDTHKILISYENESVAARYPSEYASWYDFRFGLTVADTSKTYYLNNGYLTDGERHYAMYSVCTGLSEDAVCESKFAVVEMPGQIPKAVLNAVEQYGVINPW